jgi:cytochrome c biogenesis factor
LNCIRSALVSGRRRSRPANLRYRPAGTASFTWFWASQAEDGRWQLRLWWKPFVTLIWYGGLLIALGGLLAMLGHRQQRSAPDRRAG